MFLAYRKQIESDMNRTFDTFLKDSPKQRDAREVRVSKQLLRLILTAAGIHETHER